MLCEDGAPSLIPQSPHKRARGDCVHVQSQGWGVGDRHFSRASWSASLAQAVSR